MRWRIYAPLVVFFMMCSCGQKSYRPDEFVRWVEDEKNGLRVSRNLGDFVFTLQYKPVDFMIANEAKRNEIDETHIRTRRNELNNDLHFNFIVNTNGSGNVALKQGTDEQGYFMRTTHFFNEGINDFKLYSGKDTFDCNFCHLEQTYGLATESVIVLAFEPRSGSLPEQFTDDLFMVYTDQVFGAGAIKMKLEKERLNDLPLMKAGM